MSTALTIAARGSKADLAKPMKGLGSGAMEIAVRTERMHGASYTSPSCPGHFG